MKAVNIVVSEKMKAFEVDAINYTNLPRASSMAEGIIKYDNETLKVNLLGQLYVDKAVAGEGSGGEPLAIEHIADESKHFNNARRKSVDETFPAHIRDTTVHMTELEKESILTSLAEFESHLKVFHLTEEQHLNILNLTSSIKSAIEVHIADKNAHASAYDIATLLANVESLRQMVSSLLSDYNTFKPDVNTHLQTLDNTKLDKEGHPVNKLVGTSNLGNIEFLDVNLRDILAIGDLSGDLAILQGEIESLKLNKAEKDEANAHYNDKNIHLDMSEKLEILDKIKALEKFNNSIAPEECLKLTKAPTNGQVAFYNSENEKIATPSFILSKGTFIETAKELEEAKKATIDFEDVFNRWKRFSHDTTENQPAIPSETQAWRYDDLSSKVICTVNSGSHIGFISNEKYDTYVHECTVKSTAGDNDMIGLIIAFTVDDAGREHSLTLVRTASTENHVQVPGDKPFQWGIVYNFGRSDARLITSKAIDGDRDTAWSGIPNGIRLKVERNLNSVRAYTSAMNSTSILESSMIEVDLSTNLLNKFSGEKSYGYSCLSQEASTFEDIKFLGGVLDNIYDIRNGDVWTNSSGTWTRDVSQTIVSALGCGKLLYNSLTGKLFFLKDLDNIIRINLETPAAQAISNLSYNKKSGTTSERPTNPNVYDEPYFDTDLNKALWWNGVNWIDAMGNVV